MTQADREAAATTIQAGFRGYRVRKQLKQEGIDLTKTTTTTAKEEQQRLEETTENDSNASKKEEEDEEAKSDFDYDHSSGEGKLRVGEAKRHLITTF